MQCTISSQGTEKGGNRTHKRYLMVEHPRCWIVIGKEFWGENDQISSHVLPVRGRCLTSDPKMQLLKAATEAHDSVVCGLGWAQLGGSSAELDRHLQSAGRWAAGRMMGWLRLHLAVTMLLAGWTGDQGMYLLFLSRQDWASSHNKPCTKSSKRASVKPLWPSPMGQIKSQGHLAFQEYRKMPLIMRDSPTHTHAHTKLQPFLPPPNLLHVWTVILAYVSY